MTIRTSGLKHLHDNLSRKVEINSNFFISHFWKGFQWLLASLVLTACAGQTKVEQLSADTYEIQYIESAGLSSPALVQNYMDEAAMERCHTGYDKLRDRTLKTGYMPTHIWTVKCVP